MAVRSLLPPAITDDVEGGTLGNSTTSWLGVYTEAINGAPVSADGLFATNAIAEAGTDTTTAITPAVLKHILQYYGLIS